MGHHEKAAFVEGQKRLFQLNPPLRVGEIIFDGEIPFGGEIRLAAEEKDGFDFTYAADFIRVPLGFHRRKAISLKNYLCYKAKK